MTNKEFFSFIAKCKEDNLCMNPGCTTCGCMAFRMRCINDIGFERMDKMISSVDESMMKSINTAFWYEPLEIIYGVVFRNISTDNPLMREYLRIREDRISEYNRRAYENAQRQKEAHELAELRKLERKKKSREHIERSERKRLAIQKATESGMEIISLTPGIDF